MREIKFRAWDPRFKYMNYRILVGNVTDEENYHAHGMWIEPEKVDYECEPHWSNFDEHSGIEIMQYTGLTDKNGVEIYEGDILKWGNSALKISFMSDYNFGYVLHYAASGDYVSMLNINQLKQIEVVGNIYENPELLEESK